MGIRSIRKVNDNDLPLAYRAPADFENPLIKKHQEKELADKMLTQEEKNKLKKAFEERAERRRD